jgi:hypothetical protein
MGDLVDERRDEPRGQRFALEHECNVMLERRGRKHRDVRDGLGERTLVGS